MTNYLRGLQAAFVLSLTLFTASSCKPKVSGPKSLGTAAGSPSTPTKTAYLRLAFTSEEAALPLGDDADASVNATPSASTVGELTIRCRDHAPLTVSGSSVRVFAGGVDCTIDLLSFQLEGVTYSKEEDGTYRGNGATVFSIRQDAPLPSPLVGDVQVTFRYREVRQSQHTVDQQTTIVQGGVTLISADSAPRYDFAAAETAVAGLQSLQVNLRLRCTALFMAASCADLKIADTTALAIRRPTSQLSVAALEELVATAPNVAQLPGFHLEADGFGFTIRYADLDLPFDQPADFVVIVANAGKNSFRVFELSAAAPGASE